jgi:hypothetical protein
VRNQCLTEIRNQKIKKENYSIDSEISELTERPATEPNPEERVLLKEEINQTKKYLENNLCITQPLLETTLATSSPETLTNPQQTEENSTSTILSETVTNE